MIRVKEKPDMTPNPFAATAFRRLRPDSDRAVRLMRPALLIGSSVAEMAAQHDQTPPQAPRPARGPRVRVVG
jgi:hypothetical protein